MAELHHEHSLPERGDQPVSLSHLVRVLRSYMPVITLSCLVVMVGYIIVALAIYIMAPEQRVTTMSFRLEFEGADRGEYPNGTKFSSAEIISTPVLVKAFNENNISRFTRFGKFARSLFVLESNAAQEALARDYQSRLSDARLTAVDRERIQREYELKLASLSKNQYALNYVPTEDSDPIPEVVIQKVLHDILQEWAKFVSNEQHVLEYRVPVLSPDMVASTRIEDTNPVIATEVLRAKVLRVMLNIDQLRFLPAAELVRSKPDGLSLNDIRIRLDDIVRFRLEPLIHSIAAARLDDRVATIRFLETQLAYDERQLAAQQHVADASRTALAMYSNADASNPASSGTPGSEASRTPTRVEPETVMPQLSDTFIDRLIQITSSTADHEYRQRISEQYRQAAVAIVPLQQAVAYDRSVLVLARGAVEGGNISREVVDEQVKTTRDEVRQLVVKIRQIYETLSANLNPSTELMTITGSPTTRVQRTVSPKRLGLYGILTFFIALPIIIFFCLIHNRIREEEAEEA